MFGRKKDSEKQQEQATHSLRLALSSMDRVANNKRELRESVRNLADRCLYRDCANCSEKGRCAQALQASEPATP